MKVVVDHIRGSRRGQRQELGAGSPITFGRHPQCSVSFDAHRDLDASSRHARLDVDGEGATLTDTGSSNGTFVGGVRVSEHRMDLGSSALVEFGPGGPQVAIWVGHDGDAPPPSLRPRLARRWIWPLLAAVVLAAVAIALSQVSR